jgi:hypothetical protein
MRLKVNFTTNAYHFSIVFELFNHIFKENYEQLYRRSSAKVPLTPLKLL